MPARFRLIAAALVLAAVAVTFYLSRPGRRAPDVTIFPTNQVTDWRTYQSDRFGLTFHYPSAYLVVESSAAGSGRHTILLMEDTQENRELIAGANTEAREWPPAISLDLFQNSGQAHAAREWVSGTDDSNYRLSLDGELRNITLAGEAAVGYRWDGLYRGESVVVARADWIHMWSVTSLHPQDSIIRDFHRVLATVAFHVR